MINYRIIIHSLFLITVFFAACNNQRVDEEELMELLDTINTEEEYEPIERAPTQEELIKTHKVKVKRTDYEEDDTYNINEYDQQGLLIRSEYFDGKSSKVSTYTYELDSMGRVLESVEQAGNKKYVKSYTYDEKDRTTSMTFAVDDEEPTRTTYLYYDNEHIMTEMDAYGEYVTYYDNRGLEEKVVSYNTDGKIEATIHYTYDEKGNRTKESSSIMGISIIDNMTYNERGQLLRKERGGMVTVIMSYQYDDKGLCTKFIREQGTAPTTAVYTYEYY